MVHILPKDVIQISFKLYKILGETFDGSANDNPMKLRIYRIFTCFVLVLNFILTIGSFKQAEGEMYIKSLEGTMSILHNLMKYLSVLYYKGDITSLIHDMKYFWDYQRCGPEIHKKIIGIHKIINNCQRLVLIAPISVLAVFCLRPVFNRRDKFIYYSWIPWDSEILDAFVLFTQYYLTMLITPIIYGCDFLYVSYSVHVASQIYLLNRELENLKGKFCNADIYEYIRHHQLILSIFNRMKHIFFWLLLFHYFVSLFSGCSQVYLFLIGKSKPMDLVATGMYCCCLFMQFAYYSFPVEIIVSELQYISTAIYTSPWFGMNLARRKLLLFMMMRAQRQGYLSMGGIMDMNVDTFGSVIRKIFSFCAILKNVLNT